MLLASTFFITYGYFKAESEYNKWLSDIKNEVIKDANNTRMISNSYILAYILFVIIYGLFGLYNGYHYLSTVIFFLTLDIYFLTNVFSIDIKHMRIVYYKLNKIYNILRNEKKLEMNHSFLSSILIINDVDELLKEYADNEENSEKKMLKIIKKAMIRETKVCLGKDLDFLVYALKILSAYDIQLLKNCNKKFPKNKNNIMREHQYYVIRNTIFKYENKPNFFNLCIDNDHFKQKCGACLDYNNI